MDHNQNLTHVRGITCWGAHTGVKSMRRDLAILYSERPASAAATFTTNRVVAEPLKISRRHLADGQAQVIVCSSGNANACTGEQGRQGAEAMTDAVAQSLGIDRSLVIVASTGPIGEPFPTELVVKGIENTVPKLSKDPRAGSFAANAILTTDTFAKEGFDDFKLNGSMVNIAGIAKGSGMIHPNMATMLAFIVSDVAISPKALQQATSHCVHQTFNLITVDGDTSTNDMVVVLANGMAENPTIESAEDPNFKIFQHHLEDMMGHLAKLIVSDGEGSSKFIEYRVIGAPDEESARKIARAISNSTLVKTAMYGRDPNWGRIICAGGNAGVEFDYKTLDLSLGSRDVVVPVLKKGCPVEFDRLAVKKVLRGAYIRVDLDMNSGTGECTAWGSDLTTDYVVFNSVYTT